MSQPQPAIDLSLIQFPSDKATLAELRKTYPEDLENYGPPREGGSHIERSLNLDIGNFSSMFDAERQYADEVFRHTLSLPDAGGNATPSADRLEDWAETLAYEYIRVGWAAGEHQAEELTRSIERQAQAQARKFLGRGGP